MNDLTSTTRNSRYAVYTDVSRRHHVIAYAAWIIEASVTLRKWTGILPQERKSSVAEILASTKAVSELRDGSEVIVYTDIDDLPRLVRGEHLCEWEMRTAVWELTEQLSRFSKSEVRIVDRKSPFYV